MGIILLQLPLWLFLGCAGVDEKSVELVCFTIFGLMLNWVLSMHLILTQERD